MAESDKRISHAKLLSQSSLLTPLLRQELNDFITAFQDSDSPTPLANLEDSWRQIESHWQRIFQTIQTYAFFADATTNLALFYGGLLLIEYGVLDEGRDDLKSFPYYVHYTICGSTDQRRLAADKLARGNEAELDKLFEQAVLWPARELLIDKTFLESRLQAAVNDKSMLLDCERKSDEQGLKTLIQRDKETLDLFANFENRCKTIMQAISPRMDVLLAPNARPASSLSQIPDIRSATERKPDILRRIGAAFTSSTDRSMLATPRNTREKFD